MCPSPILFSFHAEDGIRDKLVTGVQTCALPISRSSSKPPWAGAAAACAWFPTPCNSMRCSKRPRAKRTRRSEEHTSELQSLAYLVCRLLLEKKKREQAKLARLGGEAWIKK